MNNNKLTFKEIITNSQYRSIFSLMLYFVIFIVLIVFIRVSSPSVSKDDTVKDNVILTEGLNSIKNKNYNFEIIEKIDSNENIYKGKQRENKLLFENNGNEYYLNNGVLLKKQNDKYVLTDEKFFEVFNVLDIDKLLEKIEKGVEEKESIKINYNEFFDSNLEISDKYIYIKLNTQNNIVTSIDIDLDSYCDVVDSDMSTYKIILKYSDFGLIEDFNTK